MATASAFVPVKAAMAAAFLLCTQVFVVRILLITARPTPSLVQPFFVICLPRLPRLPRLSSQVLYTGLLVDLSRGGPGKQLSVFYWACNVLYWGELGGRTGSTTSTGAGPVQVRGQCCPPGDPPPLHPPRSLARSPLLFSVQVSGEELLAALSVDREPRSRALGALCLHALASLLVALGCSLRLHRDWRLNKQQRKRREQDEAAADAPSPPPHS